ncbi:hypothetical protein SDJN02_11563, partial [Cucurbita argyrosperma subsp. argyrosperma]
MESSISDTCMFLQNAQVILDSIHRTYSKARDVAQELDYYRVFEMNYTADALILKKFIEPDRKPRHTKESCWKLNGKPPNHEWDNRGGSQKHGLGNKEDNTKEPKLEQKSPILETSRFNNEEIERLRIQLNSLNKPSSSSVLTISKEPDLETDDWTC